MTKFKQIAALLLAFFILAGSSGFTIHKHYCMNELKKVSFLLIPENCHKNAESGHCSSHEKHQHEDKAHHGNCCDNRSDYIKSLDGDIEFQAIKGFSFEKKLLAIVHLIIFKFTPELENNNFSFHDYSPPLVYRDIPILNQSFLIHSKSFLQFKKLNK